MSLTRITEIKMAKRRKIVRLYVLQTCIDQNISNMKYYLHLGHFQLSALNRLSSDFSLVANEQVLFWYWIGISVLVLDRNKCFWY